MHHAPAGSTEPAETRSAQTEPLPTEPARVTAAERDAAPERAQEQSPPEAKIVTLFPGIRVHVNGKRVELDGQACLDAGWLEFVACSPQTKEHESLVVLPQQPSNIHAALLLAGFEAGHPGSWTYENEQFAFIAPSGSKLDISVRYTNERDKTVTVNICAWIRDHLGKQQFPCAPWVFGGSTFADNPEFMGEGEHYVADMTGSIIGLATFGDEVIGYSTVISHDSSVQAPEWEVNTRVVPEPGTAVTLIIEPHE